jgi:hypothetical protein
VEVLELPLMASEITGPEALLAFSQKLVGEDYRATAGAVPQVLEDWTPTPPSFGAAEGPPPPPPHPCPAPYTHTDLAGVSASPAGSSRSSPHSPAAVRRGADRGVGGRRRTPRRRWSRTPARARPSCCPGPPGAVKRP